MGSAFRTADERLSILGEHAPAALPAAADAALRDLLLRIAAAYTMASERDVYAGFLPSDMDVAAAEPIDDDGLL